MKNLLFLFVVIALVLFASYASAQKNASYVLGAMDLISQGEIRQPHGVYVSPVSGKIFVGPTNQLLRYTSAAYLYFGADPEAVFNSRIAVGDGSFRILEGFFIDKNDSLWAADFLNNRVFKVDFISKASIDFNFSLILGQPDFYTNLAGSGAAQLDSPRHVIYDHKFDCIWIADSDNHRVTRYDNGSQATTGKAYTTYLGNGLTAPSQTSLGVPYSLALDNKGNLYVGMLFSRRILRFDNAHTLPSEAPASLVLGQPDFNTAAFSDPRTFAPYYIFWFDDFLYVSDSLSNRVVIFEDVSKAANGSYPTALLGQPDFSTTVPRPVSASTLGWPVGIYASKKLLFVASFNEDRVVVYSEPKTCPPPGSCHHHSPCRYHCPCRCPCSCSYSCYPPSPCKHDPHADYNPSWSHEGCDNDKDNYYDHGGNYPCYSNEHY